MEISDIEFNFTGFGKFGTVKDNPTTFIAKSIRDFLEQNGLNVGYTKVIKVAAEDVESELLGIYNGLEIRQQENPNVRQVLIHMGVYAGSQALQLEQIAVNCSDFIIPDERKWQPRQQPINKWFGLDHKMFTPFPINEFVQNLQKKHLIIYSDNAGLYICNYCYYISLLEGTSRNIPSIFVHVPTFDVVNLQGQQEALLDLCLEIKKFYNIK